MKSHKYWSIGALITMLGTFYTGYKGSKEGHKYFAAIFSRVASSVTCPSIYLIEEVISSNQLMLIYSFLQNTSYLQSIFLSRHILLSFVQLHNYRRYNHKAFLYINN